MSVISSVLVRTSFVKLKLSWFQTDVFEIPAVDVGPLRMVIIGHDVRGRGKGWFCERVCVRYSDEAPTQTVFLCAQWLDTGSS